MESLFSSFITITQNVDGLHQRAGTDKIIELHGSIARTKCSVEGLVVEHWTETGAVPPPCPHCGSPLRPDVVWFGEGLPLNALADANDAVQGADVFFSIGTSALVQPAASLPFGAINAGALLVEINPERTVLTGHADYTIQGPAGVTLPAIVNLFRAS